MRSQRKSLFNWRELINAIPGNWFTVVVVGAHSIVEIYFWPFALVGPMRKHYSTRTRLNANSKHFIRRSFSKATFNYITLNYISLNSTGRRKQAIVNQTVFIVKTANVMHCSFWFKKIFNTDFEANFKINYWNYLRWQLNSGWQCIIALFHSTKGPAWLKDSELAIWANLQVLCIICEYKYSWWLQFYYILFRADILRYIILWIS